MEVGESVSVVGPSSLAEEDSCPFAHESSSQEIKNELGGIGTKLGENLKGCVPISNWPNVPAPAPLPDPRDRPGDKRLAWVAIEVNGETVSDHGKPVLYPLVCAAHHLIPAQESLKDHPLLQFMCKSGQEQDFRNSKAPAPKAVPNSKVWDNVGYNVNGSENGVWLPGNYGVGGGTGGLGIWRGESAREGKFTEEEMRERARAALDLTPAEWEKNGTDTEEERAAVAATIANIDFDKHGLVGANLNISPANPKWSYVFAAMKAAKGQFHDRHEDYSNAVGEYLTKVFDLYDRAYKRSMGDPREQRCEQCTKASRPSNAPSGKDLLGPPRTLLARLVVASEFFKQHVAPPPLENGKQVLVARNLYTSRWVRAWIDSVHPPPPST